MEANNGKRELSENGLWDALDVAAYMKTSRSWVYQRVALNDIPYLRVGGLLRFDPEAIRAFARGQLPTKARVLPFTPKGKK